MSRVILAFLLFVFLSIPFPFIIVLGLMTAGTMLPPPVILSGFMLGFKYAAVGGEAMRGRGWIFVVGYYRARRTVRLNCITTNRNKVTTGRLTRSKKQRQRQRERD